MAISPDVLEALARRKSCSNILTQNSYNWAQPGTFRLTRLRLGGQTDTIVSKLRRSQVQIPTRSFFSLCMFKSCIVCASSRVAKGFDILATILRVGGIQRSFKYYFSLFRCYITVGSQILSHDGTVDELDLILQHYRCAFAYACRVFVCPPRNCLIWFHRIV